AGQFFGTEQALRTLLKPLAETGTPTRFTVTSHTYMDALRMWAGCSGTISEFHLPPQGMLGRSTFQAKSNITSRPLSARGIDTLIRQIEARQTVGSGPVIILLD